MEESRPINTLKCVNDGVELMEYLERKGEFSDPEKSLARSDFTGS